MLAKARSNKQPGVSRLDALQRPIGATGGSQIGREGLRDHLGDEAGTRRAGNERLMRMRRTGAALMAVP